MDETSHTYFVPVRAVDGTAAVIVQTGRLPRGQRVGIAFTGLDRLSAAMGHSRSWIRLSASALRTMLTPLGINSIQLDPILVGPALRESGPRQHTEVPAEATRQELVGAGVLHA